VNAFHVCGGILVVWAVLVSLLGIMREDFPRTDASMRLVGAISAILVAAAIGTAIYTSATEEHESGEEEAALVLPS
jgi:integral membrane sensor domain MASE1